MQIKVGSAMTAVAMIYHNTCSFGMLVEAVMLFPSLWLDLEPIAFAMLFFTLKKCVIIQVCVDMPVSCIFVQLNEFIQHLSRGNLPLPTSSYIRDGVS
jgi:hypothetical protein